MRINSRLITFSDRLAFNLAGIQELSDGKKIIPMIKANAYGHGLVDIANFFNSFGSAIDYLGVASLGEAIYLRKIARVSGKTILVFSENEFGTKSDSEEYENYNIIPVISNLADLEHFFSVFSDNFPLVIKIDTGMNRLGICHSDIERVCAILKKHGRTEIKHVMSHYACSYLPGHKLNEIQQQQFLSVLKDLDAAGITVAEVSLDNSGAIEQGHVLQQATHVRPGIMMYGAQSTMQKKQIWHGKIISNLESKVCQVKSVKKGDHIGYGATKVQKDGTVLYLPLGYGDGITLGYQNFQFTFEEQNYQFLGRVNMDLMALFVNDQNTRLYQNKVIQLWNQDSVHFNTLVNHLGTHAYQVFCAITSRVPRQFVLK